MTRLPFRGLSIAALLLGLHFVALSACAEVQKTTHVYKTVGDVDVHADVYRPADDEVRPVVVWIHGGALIVGSRDSVPEHLRELCRDEGFVLVSIDYRLAPEVKLPQIAEDLDDAFIWLRSKGPERFRVDPDRMVITGGSAGGFCTYLAAARMQTKPRAIVSYWGYGDFDPAWTKVESQDHGEPVSKQDALRIFQSMEVVTSPSREQAQLRSAFYRYTRQHGIWALSVTGFDPEKDQDRLDKFRPLSLITKEFPPTLMIHGTVDTDVPYACSQRMAEALQRHGVPHELITVENAGHGLSGGDKSLIKAAQDRARAFIRAHLIAN
jgi:acetyl esterase/lipase